MWIDRPSLNMNKLKKIGLVVVGVGLTAAVAHADPVAPDLTAVTDGVGALKTATLAAAATIIPMGILLMSVKFGGKWVVRVFKSFTS